MRSLNVSMKAFGADKSSGSWNKYSASLQMKEKYGKFQYFQILLWEEAMSSRLQILQERSKKFLKLIGTFSVANYTRRL